MHNEAKDSGKVDIAHVDAGAVQATATGTINATVQPEAMKFSGALTNTFQSPLATVNTPVTIADGAVPCKFDFMMCPHGITGVQVEDGGTLSKIDAPITVNIDIKPMAEALKEIAKPFQETAAKAKDIYDDRWRFAAGGLLFAILVGWFFHAHGNRKVISALKSGSTLLCLLWLSGCAPLFTASGALAPKVAVIVAGAGAAGTVAKSVVDGVDAFEEAKAIMKGKNPVKSNAVEPGPYNP